MVLTVRYVAVIVNMPSLDTLSKKALRFFEDRLANVVWGGGVHIKENMSGVGEMGGGGR